jgi:hypothetical protein
LEKLCPYATKADEKKVIAFTLFSSRKYSICTVPHEALLSNREPQITLPQLHKETKKTCGGTKVPEQKRTRDDTDPVLKRSELRCNRRSQSSRTYSITFWINMIHAMNDHSFSIL